MSIQTINTPDNMQDAYPPPANSNPSGYVNPVYREHQARVAQRTLDALITRKHLSPEEAKHVLGAYNEELENQASVEIFETIVRLSTTPPRDIPQFIRQLGNAVAKTLKRNVPYIPAAGRMQLPGAFFEKHESVRPLCKSLLAPVLFAEESEVFGIGSINPCAAAETAALVTEIIGNSEPVIPFATVARLDYDTWKALLEKQFGL